MEGPHQLLQAQRSKEVGNWCSWMRLASFALKGRRLENRALEAVTEAAMSTTLLEEKAWWKRCLPRDRG